MRIYVGNMPFSLSETQLTSMFSKHGNVDSVSVVMDRETGRAKGFAFVEMNDQAEANAAIEALNGTDCEGRTIVVNEAKPREDRPARSGGGGGRGGFGGGNRGFGGGGGGSRGGFGGGNGGGKRW